MINFIKNLTQRALESIVHIVLVSLTVLILVGILNLPSLTSLALIVLGVVAVVMLGATICLQLVGSAEKQEIRAAGVEAFEQLTEQLEDWLFYWRHYVSVFEISLGVALSVAVLVSLAQLDLRSHGKYNPTSALSVECHAMDVDEHGLMTLEDCSDKAIYGNVGVRILKQDD